MFVFSFFGAVILRNFNKKVPFRKSNWDTCKIVSELIEKDVNFISFCLLKMEQKIKKRVGRTVHRPLSRPFHDAYFFLLLSYANQGINLINHEEQTTIVRAKILSCLDFSSLLLTMLTGLQRLQILKSVRNPTESRWLWKPLSVLLSIFLWLVSWQTCKLWGSVDLKLYEQERGGLCRYLA